jgi:hypothetical protein
MASNQSDGPENELAHIVYDKATGRIVGRFRKYDATRNEFSHSEPDEVLSAFNADEQVLARLTDGDPQNLSVLTATLPKTSSLNALLVSSKRKALVQKPRLRLRTDRETLEGDGQDSITISIDVVDEKDRIVRDYKGEIQITTSRGKLSARGGVVAIDRGQGSVGLTSVRETVNRVEVSAKAPDGSAVSDDLLLRFE